MPEIYYNRLLPDKMSSLIAPDGKLRWLFDVVRQNNDLDFLIGRNLTQSWISVYRGLSRLIRVKPAANDNEFLLDADESYVTLYKEQLYGIKTLEQLNFRKAFEWLLNWVRHNQDYDWQYNNRKEGFYQNHFSRNFGITGSDKTELVVFDKEVSPVFYNNSDKQTVFGNLQAKYKTIYKHLSQEYPEKFGKNLEKRHLGKEIDFFGLDNSGRLLVIEFKHHSSPSGIYLSPVQIGLYYALAKMLYQQNPERLTTTIREMILQKQKLGLINAHWKVPESINEIVPVLMISGYNPKSNAKNKFKSVLKECRALFGEGYLQNIETYEYSLENGMRELIFS